MTVPLLEYLDKLEANANPNEVLALIAKLREAVRLAVLVSLHHNIDPRIQVEIDRLEYIEVPE